MTLINNKNNQKTQNNIEYNRQKIGIQKKNTKELDILFKKLDENLEKMAKSSDLTIDELIDILDPSKPFLF